MSGGKFFAILLILIWNKKYLSINTKESTKLFLIINVVFIFIASGANNPAMSYIHTI